MSPGDSVLALAREAGFHRAGWVDPRFVIPLARRARALRTNGFLDQGAFEGLEWDWIFEPERWSETSSLLVCCLSCARHEPDDLSRPGDPHALIAPFARANYYRMAMGMLRGLARRLEEVRGIPRASIRLFANSRIPEKPLLVASGLAAYGRNGLALVPGLGSMFVIGGAVIPLPSVELRPADAQAQPRGDLCGSCTRCMSACPVGAIEEPGLVSPGRCLQGLAGSAMPLEPRLMELWGTRLYGCQECQAACPHNQNLNEEAPFAAGELGPSVSIRRILSMDAAGLKEWFRGTAMGMSWVSGNALMRNALIAAGNSRDPGLRTDVERFTTSREPLLRQTARWALERMSKPCAASTACSS
jgi:epoxyqueuosine reductase